ncbi:UDP-3-O-acyl-N-acetylglucosamine deacetylase [Rhodospirillum rubrum]|uniref:UDP-3-O-acyl-N-acetylglucosamine deacetylase n=1 Tax=Rhodospirillum rubrum (strain ATCC 11170 / ATH 1.1.1 / DSM 467 / LMG 4362 / NCIMB 8255 / S1) TaxID=269796 RepID=Q2RVV1_RHORT|nr:UDP-3-O-acyl-N-acetylglucosamine deacetylase [Rhodospirillum rubrum]ABC21744.1 UDP-3-O-[3-hydroxymyristoyl] N-acetylglucosamine deacetylase [Rhodospirillum rubrum ATCC 11170]AEO47442.1 UDP-3-O-[3-hydroxymyristoyl] N-acetylglucosamine deacetylase [Rhodospirillum rubrum F11]MBK5953300.1 UDP-3-O-[3-hydroxymyristoyl] N-acetylglucosamine deacetylase [Rhodospirillum rubrum]QXG81406.1 UDP-3-O-acyl-N-acetylglucosamine deacetylase [Rhodospirillum rubrum]HAQ00323.1 UDP-3-O-acyl-N-acetylglucosamine de
MDGLNYDIDTSFEDRSSSRSSSRAKAGLGVIASGIARQHTLKTAISCTGVGVHRGREATLTLRPAPVDTGIVFNRTDILDDNAAIRVSAQAVIDGRLCTTIANEAGATVSTVEHLMAAFAAQGIDNVIVDVNGPEVPIMDGSAAPFVFLIDCAGVVDQALPRKAIRVRKAVTVVEGPVLASLMPAERGLSVDFEIDFAARAIGRQGCHVDLTPDLFRAHIARARTFGLRSDVDMMRAAGLGLGGSLENAVVVDDDLILNDEGLRYEEEFVRHKALDAIGDLYMAGAPIIGRYHGVRSSHAHNNKLVRALLADPANYSLETVDETDLAAPGQGRFDGWRDTDRIAATA